MLCVTRMCAGLYVLQTSAAFLRRCYVTVIFSLTSTTSQELMWSPSLVRRFENLTSDVHKKVHSREVSVMTLLFVFAEVRIFSAMAHSRSKINRRAGWSGNSISFAIQRKGSFASCTNGEMPSCIVPAARFGVVLSFLCPQLAVAVSSPSAICFCSRYRRLRYISLVTCQYT